MRSEWASDSGVLGDRRPRSCVAWMWGAFLLPILSAGVLRAQERVAFPGAEGFGAVSKGGRGGKLIRVTNLNTQGPGSLQSACSMQGPRLVVFDVSGVIPGDVTLEHGDLTIAGQTAPGDGITIAGSLFTNYSAPAPITDLIVRFLRVRPPNAHGRNGDAIQMSNCQRLILDHVCCSWGGDETVDIYDATDVTIQYCTIAESRLDAHPESSTHNYGLISGPRARRISIHHSLFAHHRRRCPAIACGPADFRNNVVYNFRDGLSHEGHPSNGVGINLVGNYYKAGPSDRKQFPFCFQNDHSYFVRNNLIDGVGVIDDPWVDAAKHPGLMYYADQGNRLDKEVRVPTVTTDSPQEAFRIVLTQAGCIPHDSVTRRIVIETRAGTGAWGRPAITPERSNNDLDRASDACPVDTDEDGIPDNWELEHGLNPTSPSDAHLPVGLASSLGDRHAGYSFLEAYINDRAEVLLDRWSLATRANAKDNLSR